MKKILLVTAFAITILFFARGATGLSNSEIELCFSSNRLDNYHEEHGDEAYQEILEKCEDYLGDLQGQYEEDIERTEQEKQSLANQIATLENRMDQLDRQIQQSEMRIRNLGVEIQNTKESIRRMNARIEESKDHLGEILKTVNREDRKTILEILIQEEDLSGFFNQITALESLSTESQTILEEIREVRNSLETEEQRLARERQETQRQVELQSIQKEESRQARQEHAHLYNMTEQEYQKQVEQKEFIEERVQEILNRRLTLFGVDEEDSPSLERAIEIVEWVEGKTGVRAGFVLSIIMQESALGRNVGQCYLRDTGSGASINRRTGQLYQRGIHEGRDLGDFLTITSRFNRDPLETPISCYIPMCYSGSTGHITTNVSMNSNGLPNCPGGYVPWGFGGAMGPAQFIPDTWESVRGAVKSRLGREPNPWGIEDSFLASGVYLSQLGGTTAHGELNAAARYYGAANIGYESAVMQRAGCLQTYIDQGTMSSNCQRYITPFLD